MENVFALFLSNRDGEHLIGLYSTKDKAEEALTYVISRTPANPERFVDYYYTELSVDSKPNRYFTNGPE